MRVQRLR